MNAQLKTPAQHAALAARFDRPFIEEHQLLERYLTNKLPTKGAQDLESWCRANPEYLDELKLAVRAQMSLKLLEASGKPHDLAEPRESWWRSIYCQIGLIVVCAFCLIGFWAMYGKYVLMRGDLEDSKTIAKQGPLMPPTTLNSMRVEPDRAPGIDHAGLNVSRALPALLDLSIDMSFSKLTEFKVQVDKQYQGRALVISNLSKDSNGDLRIAFNTSGLAQGKYAVRIDGLPYRGEPIGLGWLILTVH